MARRNEGETKPGSHHIGPSLTNTGIFKSPVRKQENSTPKAVRIDRAGVAPFVLPLYPDKTYIFGRSPDSSVVLPSDAVSRLHGQLRFTDAEWVYRDLNSRNGTHLLEASDGPPDDSKGRRKTIGPSKEIPVHVGQALLLGNRLSRLTFLGELPEGSVAGPRPTEDSEAATTLKASIEICARHRLPVFLLGDSGVGKTHVARVIHEKSRLKGHFVIINCGRLPTDAAQLTSELLGHVRGAFTGADSDRRGKLWRADGGTLFLDEVESLPPNAQDFLIDVLEGSGNFAPYGAPGDMHVAPPRFRLISASKVPLLSSRLRPDLCQRLGAGDVVLLPGLKERKAEIPALVQKFLAQLGVEQRIDAEFTPDAVRELQDSEWPGEIRELESTVRVVASRGQAKQVLDGTEQKRIVIGLDAVRTYLEQRRVGFGSTSEASGAGQFVPATVVRKRPGDLTKEELEQALAANDGNLTRTAMALNVAVNTLKARLRAAGLR